MEKLGVDAPRPAHQVPESSPCEVRMQLMGCDHHRLRRRVKSPQPGVGQRDGQPGTRMDIFRKPGVVGRRERKSLADAELPRREPDWTFGRYVDSVRRKPARRAGEPAKWTDREADLRIGRTGDASKTVRADRFNDVARSFGA